MDISEVDHNPTITEWKSVYLQLLWATAISYSRLIAVSHSRLSIKFVGWTSKRLANIFENVLPCSHLGSLNWKQLQRLKEVTWNDFLEARQKGQIPTRPRLNILDLSHHDDTRPNSNLGKNGRLLPFWALVPDLKRRYYI